VIFSLLGLALFAVGILMFFLRRRSAALQAASVNWPTVDGQISDAKLHTFRDKEKRLNYMARVWHTYQVNGASYTVEKISWGGQPYAQVSAPANAVLEKYPVGSVVKVYYNPQKPKQSVLNPQEKGGLATMAWIAGIFFVMGVVFFVLGFFVKT
jgi:hypothetical protein